MRRLLIFAALALTSTLHAQTRPPADSQRMAGNFRAYQFIQAWQMANSRELASAINALLQDDGPHMHMAAKRAATAADTARAAAIVKTARAALSKYSDIKLAEHDGYVKFMPWLEEQSIYHYNNIGNVIATMNAFDVAKPASLLYKKDDHGQMQLVGVMYNAVPSSTPDDLDKRLPTSIAHWHEHVDFCSARPDSVKSGAVKADAATVAKYLKITTKAECDADNGIFIPRIFGWMAHVYPFTSDDPTVIWGEEHGSMDMHMHHPPRH